MFYFGLPIILIIYFEFLGRLLVYKFKLKNLKLYFPIGYFSFLGITYLLSFLTTIGIYFWMIVIIYLLLFLVGLFLIFKNIKHIDLHFSLIEIIVCLLITLLLSYYSWNTTLGNLNGFDSTFYLNFVSENIVSNKLNNFDIYLNNQSFTSLTYYSGQTYYYLASVLIYLYGKIATLLKVEYYYATAYIWTFQIMFNACFAGGLLEALSRTKNRLLNLALFIPLIFVLGRLYYNNVYGFFGNSYLMLVLTYVSLFLVELFNNNLKNVRYFIYFLLLGSCAFTSSGIYSLLFVLFGMFFLLDGKEIILKEYAFVLFIPLYNALIMERYSTIITIAFSLSIALFLYFVASRIVNLITKYNLWKYILLSCFLLTFILSRFVSEGLFDFSGLFNTKSQIQDMTLYYFNFSFDNIPTIFYKILVLCLLFSNLLINIKNKYIMFIWVLIICFLNPFSCNIINSIIDVYYRCYVIFINPFTLLYFFDLLLERINKQKIKIVISIALGLAFVVNINFLKPIYYHYQHEPTKDYCHLYKMTKDEIDVIRELKSNIIYRDIEKPYIITNNILTMSMLPNGKYLFARGNIKSPYWSNAEKRLQEIFYLPEYLGDLLVEHPDYDNMAIYLEEAKVDYLVIDKRVEYYDVSDDEYYYLMYKVDDCTNTYPYYENDTYVIYYLGND